MYIVLDEQDYKAIADVIADSNIEDGHEYVEIQGLEFAVKFTKEVDGYYEDEYDTGTGAWVTTSVYVRIYSITYSDIVIEFNSSKLEKMTEDLLKQ